MQSGTIHLFGRECCAWMRWQVSMTRVIMLAPCRSRIRLSEMTVMGVGTVVPAVMPTHEALANGQLVAGQVPYMAATATALQWLLNERKNCSSLPLDGVS